MVFVWRLTSIFPARAVTPLPANGRPILMRTPYGKRNEGDGRYLAARGYAVVFQVRGRFRPRAVAHVDR